ncbi:MAG: hypothetical protein NDJ90_03765 [Oligoflexia bacterium]|nr:hypothetical protein [Oligoflexia bacterium]
MKAFLAVTAFLFSTCAAATITGFSEGNELKATPVQGDLRVHCSENGKVDFATYVCNEVILDPAEYSYFVTDAGGSADTVILTSTWENGKTVTKKKAFDAVAGQSKDPFNLWVATLLQRPLLNYGQNQIHYTLKSDGSVEREGDFVATVQEGALRQCPPDTIFSNQLNDCRISANVCQQYLSRHRYCR